MIARNHVEHGDRQRRVHALVREQHTLTVSRMERHNSALSDAIHIVCSWVWTYNNVATTRQGA